MSHLVIIQNIPLNFINYYHNTETKCCLNKLLFFLNEVKNNIVGNLKISDSSRIS